MAEAGEGVHLRPPTFHRRTRVPRYLDGHLRPTPLRGVGRAGRPGAYLALEGDLVQPDDPVGERGGLSHHFGAQPCRGGRHARAEPRLQV